MRHDHSFSIPDPQATTDQKNQALRAAAAALREGQAQILAANREDLAAATGSGLSPALLDRLTLHRSLWILKKLLKAR